MDADASSRGAPATRAWLCDDPAAGLCVAAAGEAITVALDGRESPALRRAAGDLVSDLRKVCGARARVGEDAAGARIVVGTLGGSRLVTAALDRGEVDVSALLDADGTPRREAFVLQATSERLYVIGADRRGAIYGVYELCEAMGVSPWWWFADVPPRRRDHVVVRHGTLVADHPSVAYRGIFINDEEELEAWAAAHTSEGTIGPSLYARVFELLLRLKANYIWPAMHVAAFNADPANGRLAEEMGIVVGTSHCDMLLRSNEHEWGPWQARQDEPVAYDYSIPGRNREKLREYWRGSVEQNRHHEVSWTLGMRGIHDTGLVTSALDSTETLGGETSGEDARTAARVRLLEQAIADQRDLLTGVLGEDRAGEALQTFVPYKEVLPLYDAGLRLPEDVTIVWTDDNFGHVRRVPDERERRRRGGHGLYYHSSYWSPPPRSYLFISSMPLAHMKAELGRAWECGIRTMWVNNVGSIKPLEQDVEFFLRYAWEVGKETTTASTTAWLTGWVDRSFSGDHGHRLATLLEDYAQLTNVRKVEHLDSRAFSQTGHGDEAGRRLARLRALFEETCRIWRSLPVRERDAFVQLVAFKVHVSYLTNAQYYHADRSLLAHDQGRYRVADHHLAVSRRFADHRRALVRFYNSVMSGGKWDGICAPEEFPPPTTALHPAARPALRVGDPRLAVTVWGQGQDPGRDPGHDPAGAELRLTFWPGGAPVKWIEIANAGAGELEFEVRGEDWLEVGCASGRVSVERRIEVRLTDPALGRCGRLVVHSPTDGRTFTVAVTVVDAPRPAAAAACWLEADGCLSIPAGRPDERWPDERHDDVQRDVGQLRWAEVPRLGRGGGSAMQVRRPGGAGEEIGVGAGVEGGGAQAWLGYRIHLATPGAHLLELHRFPGLDATGRIRVAVAVDDHPPVVLESPTTDEHRGVWERAVVENVERLRLRLPHLEAGEHLLRVLAVDEWFAFDRIVVHTTPPGGTAPGWSACRGWPAAMAPPTSQRADVPTPWTLDPDPGESHLEPVEGVRSELYRAGQEPMPPAPVVYVPRDYWDGPNTFRRNESVPERLGPPRALPEPDGRVDRLAHLPRGPVVERDGAIAVEAARALLGTGDGWLTPSLDEDPVSWRHAHAETDGGTGLAMHVDAAGSGQRRQWPADHTAPGLHVRIEVVTGGRYRVWALVRFTGYDDDALALALDGVVQPPGEQFCGGSLYSFGTQQVWVWAELSELDVTPGVHTLSVLAVEAGLRVARLFLTLGDERPPLDARWP